MSRWLNLGPILWLVAALAASAGGLYYQTQQNARLKATVEQQESVIAEQAAWANRLDNALSQREAELSELQESLSQTVEEWSRYRESMEDSCVNSAHPDLYRWLHQ
jgi:uncharacterized protein HemX